MKRIIILLALYVITPLYADFQELIYVKGVSELTEKIITEYKKRDFQNEIYVKFKTLEFEDGASILSLCKENKVPTAYITLRFDIAPEHGNEANSSDLLMTFPSQIKVDKPKFSYSLSFEKIKPLTEYIVIHDMAMCGLVVTERESRKATWIKTMVKISFENDEKLFEFIKKLSPLLINKNDRKFDGYLGIYTFKY